MKEFYTAKAHSKAQKMPLMLPDGTETEHFIMVLGSQSKPARESKAEALRLMLDGQYDKESVKYMMISSYIDSWSFDEDCTEESKIKFLKNAPQIADSIDIFAANHKNFAKK